MFTLIPQIEKKMVIKARDIKTSAGHQNHFTGTGVHKDKRLRRQGTRSAQFRKALAE
jgi:hypothetical protein